MEPPTSNRKIESLSAPWTWQIHSKAPRQSEPAISGHFLHRCSARKWKATWNTNKQRWGFSNHRTFFCLDTFPFGKKPTWSKCDALKKNKPWNPKNYIGPAWWIQKRRNDPKKRHQKSMEIHGVASYLDFCSRMVRPSKSPRLGKTWAVLEIWYEIRITN